MSLKRLLTDKQHQFLYEEYHKFLNTGKKNKLKYKLTDFYELLRNTNKDFKKFSDRELTNQIIASRRVEGIEEWPNISDIQNYISPYIRSLVEKSHKSALLAVEIYNKPLIEYRTEGFLVMIMIAWTSLFHAILLNENKKIKYNINDNEYIDLRKCIRKYDGYIKDEISANLNLLIEIRDRIVHRDNPILDDRLFGHCQACLLNFEEILISSC